MRTAVTLAKKHSGQWVMLGNPDTPLADQNKTYRSFLLEKAHPDYCYVQIQESDGLFRRTHLRTMDAQKEHTAQLDKQNDDARKAGELEISEKDKRRKEQEAERAKQHESEIEQLNKQIEADNNSRTAKKPATAQDQAADTAPKPGGPTIEDWTEAGYNPVAYPPEGFSEVDSPGLVEFKATGKITPRVPHVVAIIPAEGSVSGAAAESEAAPVVAEVAQAPAAPAESAPAPAEIAQAPAPAAPEAEQVQAAAASAAPQAEAVKAEAEPITTAKAEQAGAKKKK